ncbi:MAG: LysM peptidoglycan-binding domain-containing protein [Puniceicoccales bacterium]|jgi:LysM repeat protein|nr:LysM peptidoglycan-binding domain-containing protein [Puniceicoccales bacterium]
MKRVLASMAKKGLLLAVLGLAGCVTPFGSRTVREPSPEDTIIIHKELPQPVAASVQRVVAAPRRPEPEPEEVLIVAQEMVALPTSKPVGAEYTVRKGDCLIWITKKFQISLKDLLDANGLDRSAKLSIGQKLVLPGVTQDRVDAMNSAPSEYIVKKGDCLSLIAHKYGVSVRELRLANNLQSDRIIAGKKLIIPECGRYAGRGIKENDKSKVAKEKKIFEVDGDGYYTIRKGDSLSTIASRAKVSIRDLQNWNNISDPARIRVGERILVKNKTVIPENMIKKEPTILPSAYSTPQPIMRETDFFGVIDEIPVVQVQD